MKTFRLWLEQDKEIPHFKRLCFKIVDVSITDVLRRGIHPWQGGNVHHSLSEKMIEVINTAEVKIMEITHFGYCPDISVPSSHYYYQNESSLFEETLKSISQDIYFVDKLAFKDLVRIAKEQLQKNWSGQIAYRLLSRVYIGFDEIRRFLKTKDMNIKLSGYRDLNNYDLSQILNISDFENEDQILITEGLPVTNFRNVDFLTKVTEENQLLRLTDGIRDFKVVARSRRGYSLRSVVYNCTREGEQIRFIPELDADTEKRNYAKSLAEQWRVGVGRYCFATDIAHLTKMLDNQDFRIDFPTLNYMEKRKPDVSCGEIKETGVQCYRVGQFITIISTVNSIKKVLQRHGVSMVGRKEELIEKLAELAVKIYRQRKSDLDSYFNRYHFIRFSTSNHRDEKPFPMLEDLDIRNLVLAMYIVRHLRGNAILEAQHENTTYDLIQLAESLIKNEVTLSGAFLKVE